MTPHSDDEMDLLVAYALDSLDAAEAERVSRMLAERPELRATVAELRAALDTLPYALPEPEVAPELREQVLANAVGRPVRSAAPRPTRSNGPWWRALTLAFGGLSAALAVVLAVVWGQLGSAQRDLALARADLEQALAEREQIVRVVSDYETVAELAGSGGRGAVLRTTAGDTLVAARLPQLPAGRVYQLWLIGGQGAPVSGGTFEVDASGYGVVALAPGAGALSADIFAVTEEPGPNGSAGPTSDPILAGSPVRT
jgi:anti-sigma-K factor RskA